MERSLDWLAAYTVEVVYTASQVSLEHKNTGGCVFDLVVLALTVERHILQQYSMIQKNILLGL